MKQFHSILIASSTFLMEVLLTVWAYYYRFLSICKCTYTRVHMPIVFLFNI